MFSKSLQKPRHSPSHQSPGPKSTVQYDGSTDFQVYLKDTADGLATNAEAGGIPAAIFLWLLLLMAHQ